MIQSKKIELIKKYLGSNIELDVMKKTLNLLDEFEYKEKEILDLPVKIEWDCNYFGGCNFRNSSSKCTNSKYCDNKRHAEQ